MKQNDTSPPLTAQLTNANGPQDLTGATVTMSMRLQGSSANKISDAACSIVGNPTLGNVQYNWQAGDTNTAGVFAVEFRVTFSNGTIATFPSIGQGQWTIQVGLG